MEEERKGQFSASNPNTLQILSHQDGLVAVNKPPGLLVHRTKIAREATAFALQLLRDQVGRQVYPVHRLDRKTSGVLLFTLEKPLHREMQLLFASHEVKKTYWAIVRGFTADEEVIDYPLVNPMGKLQDALTRYVTFGKAELPVPFGKHITSRYSLVEVKPKTGRTHQIRRHLAHIHHPVIGDRPHGCNKQNRLFKEKWYMTTMMLHARALRFKHPTNGQLVNIEAPLHSEFKRMMSLMAFSNPKL